MSEALAAVTGGAPSAFSQRWAIHAMHNGKILPLTPKYFPFTDSKMELLERVREKIERDAAFAVRFHGHLLLPVNINDSIIVKTVPRIEAKAS